jgi:hypothetical protein
MSCQISSLFCCLVMEYSNDSFQRSLRRRERNMDLDIDMSSPLGEGGVSECRRLLGM